MKTRSGVLNQVIEFLEGKGWRRVREAERFHVYRPRGARPGGFELFVPRDPGSPDFHRAIEHTLEAIASYYDSPLESLEALLLPENEVVSVRLQGEGYRGGAAPFPRFEGMLEHLKRAIARTVGFIVTDDPVAPSPTPAAQAFLNDCWFLQTARGSFIARVAMPTSGDLNRVPQMTLWDRPRSRALVPETLRQVSELVSGRVLRGDETLFTPQGFNEIRENVSVNVLEEMSQLLRSAKAEAVEFTFDRQGEERRIQVSDLTRERLQRLDRFVDFARAEAKATFRLQAEGQVFLWKRSRKESERRKSSLAGISAMVEGRMADVTFLVEPGALDLVFSAARSGQRVRVRGKARRMRTQLRIEPPAEIEVLPEKDRA